MVDDEEVLPGGNVAAEVVRVGQTVRKPATEATPAVAALLHYLKAAGFDGSPEHLGVDDTTEPRKKPRPHHDSGSERRSPGISLCTVPGHA